MEEVLEQLFITDRDIFDLVMSSKQRLTLPVIRSLLRDRRIFCSRDANREDLANHLSMLPHDYNDLASLIESSSAGQRMEKTTFVELPPDVSVEDVKAAIRAYAHDVPADKVSFPSTGRSSLSANIEYTELDFSRNRLAQRQKREAQIEVSAGERATILRMPANDKTKHLVDDIRRRISEAKLIDLPVNRLSLAPLRTPESRSAFFTTLITSIPGFDLQTVTSVKVATFDNDGPEDDLDDEVGDAREEALAVVNKVALGGENLIATEEFRQLSDRGFFIVGLTWRSIQKDTPGDLMKFGVSFEEPVPGNGMRYTVRYAQRLGADHYATSFRRLPDSRESALFGVLEKTAMNVLSAAMAEEGR